MYYTVKRRDGKATVVHTQETLTETLCGVNTSSAKNENS